MSSNSSSNSKKLVALPYYGGKSGYGLGRWIASILPWEKKTTYVEPFAGMAGVLLNREPVKMEIINDINERVINWWRVVRDQPEEFGWLVENTPVSRSDFTNAIEELDDMTLTPIRRALAFHTCITQSITSGDNNLRYSQWRRHLSPDIGSLGKWRSERVARLAYRMFNVQLENCNAIDLLNRMSRYENAVIYCDPPYKTANTTAYKYNNTNIEGFDEALRAQSGKVGISGYGDEWEHLGWSRHSFPTLRRQIGSVTEKREEILWTNF